MKAFLVGLLFIFAVLVLAGIGCLLFPLLIVLHILLRFIFAFILLIFAIWLLGKFIIWIWGKVK